MELAKQCQQLDLDAGRFQEMNVKLLSFKLLRMDIDLSMRHQVMQMKSNVELVSRKQLMKEYAQEKNSL